MKITVAESAGFCFGVNRAVEMVLKLLDEGKTVDTLGPIIHNPQMVKELEEKGVKIVFDPGETRPNATLVVRSHGVSRQVKEKIKDLGIACADATCPFVSKIHQIVSDAVQRGDTVLIAGDASHPEVQGITGYCENSFYVFRNSEEIGRAHV